MFELLLQQKADGPKGEIAEMGWMDLGLVTQLDFDLTVEGPLSSETAFGLELVL